MPATREVIQQLQAEYDAAVKALVDYNDEAAELRHEQQLEDKASIELFLARTPKPSADEVLKYRGDLYEQRKGSRREIRRKVSELEIRKSDAAVALREAKIR